MLTADAIGGVWNYALDLASQLAHSGVEVGLATMGVNPIAQQQAEARNVQCLRLYQSDFKLEWMDDPWDDVRRAAEWLLGLQAEFEPDLIHLNGYVHASLPWGVPVLVAGHSCVLSWWLAVKGESAPTRWDRYRHEVMRGLRAADRVVAPTAAMLRSLELHYGPLGAAQVIPNGRDPARFIPADKEPFI